MRMRQLSTVNSTRSRRDDSAHRCCACVWHDTFAQNRDVRSAPNGDILDMPCPADHLSPVTVVRACVPMCPTLTDCGTCVECARARTFRSECSCSNLYSPFFGVFDDSHRTTTKTNNCATNHIQMHTEGAQRMGGRRANSSSSEPFGRRTDTSKKPSTFNAAGVNIQTCTTCWRRTGVRNFGVNELTTVSIWC